MSSTRRRLAALFAAILFILSGAPRALALDPVEMRTVRVGFYRSVGYHYMDENGNRSGYGYDILQAMKLYNNWTYEYVGYDKGWADIQQMILDGEVDLAVSAVKTPARAEIYDFSDRAIGQSGACILVKAGESPYIAGQYESYNGMRIGFIENASQIATTAAFAEEKGFTFEPVYYKTSGELEAAVLDGSEVDAVVTSNLRIVAGTRRLEMYATQDIHVMVQKGNSELLSEVNFALEQISLYSPGLYDSLFNKYYSIDTGGEVFFSPVENELIAECRESKTVLRAALAPDSSPYSFFVDGEPSGILYDISTEILRRTGLEYQIIAADNDAEYRDLIENKAVDLRLAARHDYNYAEELGYTLTDPYYNTDISRVTRKDFSGNVESIACVRNSTIETYYLPTILNGEDVSYYDTVEECVDAVLGGSCDALYLYTRTAQEAVYNDVTNRLTSVIMPGFNVGFSIGVRDDADSRLASVLQKAAVSLGEEDVDQMVLKYTNYAAKPVTLIGILYNNPALVVAAVALLLILIFAGVMLAFIARKRKQEEEKNAQLQDALDLAEQANSAKSIFMSRMSHEIRTPLNAIVGYNTISTSTLSKANTEQEYRQAAMKAMDCLSKSDIASKHLLTVINDVLDMSAIESGKIKIAHEPFDFKNMISSLTVMFYSQAKSKDIDFEVSFVTPVDEWLVGDQMRISQILTNLLSNAVKFTPEGGKVRLLISQAKAPDGGANMRFEIKDTGIGMSKEFLSNLWTPFEQADATISRRFGGTGLGLSITKNLADLMRGTVVVQSEQGVGSTFTVELPLETMKQPAKDKAFDFSGINALVADDEQSARDYLRLLFSRAGVKCATVSSGEEAIDAVARGVKANEPFTVCLIDWRMPGNDGMETVKAIRELAGPEIPIIVISAYDFSEISEGARNAGVNLFVTKPLFQSTVFDLLANISGNQSAEIIEKTKGPDFGGARIILAEDNQMNMEIAKAILRSWNLTVDEAWNGTEAQMLLCSSPAGTYKAILMDVHMPEIDGYRATKLIRESSHPDAATVPIIAMTADVFAEDVAKALAAGMNDHIGKPIDKTVLLDTLRKYV